MKRSGTLKRTELKRKTRIKRYNRERMYRKRHDESGFKHSYGPYHEWIKTRCCTFLFRGDHKCFGSVTGHHLEPGEPDYGNEIPTCEGIHTEIHSLTAQDIRKKYGLTKLGMELEARALAREWDKDHG